MERKLASVQIIKSLNPIENADKIEVAEVLGWKVVVQKGLHKVNDKIIYCEVDSILPKEPEFEFLSNKNYRIKTCKLRGQISQGIIFPLSILSLKTDITKLNVEDDITEIMGVTKYEVEIPANLAGHMLGKFPCFLHKTDEIRLQSVLDVMEEIKGVECYISTKMDGSSITVYNKDGQFGICSRNLELKETEENAYWQVARKYKLKEKLPNNYCIQAELCGPGVQKNRLGLKELDMFVFNVYDIQQDKYLDYEDFIKFCIDNGFKHVPIEKIGMFNYTLEEWIKRAEGMYEGTYVQKEGIVIRPTKEMYSKALKGRLSFKVINNNYLLKEDN